MFKVYVEPLITNYGKVYYEHLRFLIPCGASFKYHRGQMLCLNYYEKIRSSDSLEERYRPKTFPSIERYYLERENPNA